MCVGVFVGLRVMAYDTGRGKHYRLLEDEDVRRWYGNICRGAESTGIVYLGTLGRVLEGLGLDAKQLVALSQKDLDDLVEDVVAGEFKRGIAPTTVKATRKVIVSWLAWNGRELGKRRGKVHRAHTQSNRRLRVPSREELRAVLHACDARAKVAVGFMALAGQRPQVLGKEGRDGLVLEDLLDLRVDGRIIIEKTPLRFRVRGSVSKTGIEYQAFLPAEACEYLTVYLQERINKGEALGPASPVLKPERSHKPFLSTHKTWQMLRPVLDAGGLQGQPPYILRSYYSSFMALAERDFNRDWKEFCMGHTSDVSRTYNVAKQLPDEIQEQMRQAFDRASRSLETATVRQVDPRRLAMRGLLLSQGRTPGEVDALDLENMDKAEFDALLAETMQPQASEAPAAVPATAVVVRQRIVALDDLDAAIMEGWLYKASLADGRVILEQSA